jgi:hypothetical protein
VIAYTCKYSAISVVLIEIFQHNQQYDTLLPVSPCTHKWKAGIAYSDPRIYTLPKSMSLWLQSLMFVIDTLRFNIVDFSKIADRKQASKRTEQNLK